jgi:hypothetical protein
MRETPEQYLLGVVRKCAGLVVRGIVTSREFINRMFDEFAYAERVYPELVPELWAAIPDGVRSMFAEAVRDAARPDFRYHAFYLGGEPPMTEEELRRDAELRTGRVQAWVREFVRFLAGVDV